MSIGGKVYSIRIVYPSKEKRSNFNKNKNYRNISSCYDSNKMLIPVGRGKFFFMKRIASICLSFSLIHLKTWNRNEVIVSLMFKKSFLRMFSLCWEMVTIILFHSVLILKTYWRFSMCKTLDCLKVSQDEK